MRRFMGEPVGDKLHQHQQPVAGQGPRKPPGFWPFELKTPPVRLVSDVAIEPLTLAEGAVNEVPPELLT